MLRVDKKNSHGKRKWLPWLMILMIAALCGFFAARMLREDPMPERQDTRGSIVNRDTSEIAWMRITVRGREPWEAERNAEGEMTLTGGAGWTLDATLGDRIEDALANLVYEDILTEDAADYQDRLADFGLDDPALIAEARYTDGAELILRIGDDSGLEDMHYRFMTINGDPRLYAVSGTLAEELQVEQELLHPVTQPEIQTSRLDRVTVRDAAGETIAEWVLEGEITASDAMENWRVNKPVSYPADQDAIQNLKKNVGNLKLGLYIGEATEGNKTAYGLDHPRWELEIHLAAGTTGQIVDGGAYDVREWGEETIRFLIGGERNEMTAYCLFEGTVYTMNQFTLAAIAEVDPMTTLARYPVTVAAENLSSLEIFREDGTADLYELTYTSVPAEDEEDAETLATCRKNGVEMAYSVFEAAYERWLTVNVSGKLPDGWEKRETKVKYIFHTLSGGTHTVELSDFDAMHDAVTVDGRTLFYLIKDGMGEMP